MPLEPGGYAEKLGNRYEGRWGVRQLLHLLSEEIVTVTIEPLGDDEPGVDLWIERRDGSRQGQQCKHHDKSWTLADLNARGVLRARAFSSIENPSYQFALISPATSPALGPLCESCASRAAIRSSSTNSRFRLSARIGDWPTDNSADTSGWIPTTRWVGPGLMAICGGCSSSAGRIARPPGKTSWDSLMS